MVSLAQDHKAQTRFYKGSNGRLDHSGSLDTKKNTLHMKCSDDVRFYFDSYSIND